MNNFDELKKQWEQREIPAPPEGGSDEIIRKSRYLHKKQLIGQAVLGSTVLLLLLFFFYVSAYRNSTAFWGLWLMMGSLLLRMGIEGLSMVKRRKFAVGAAMTDFNRELISYYKARKYIHFLLTPLLFAAYIGGFLMLLPIFEQQLSAGFYTYIFYSSWVIFFALAVLIVVQIRKELEILRSLISILSIVFSLLW